MYFMELVWLIISLICLFVVLRMLFKWLGGNKYAFTPDGIKDDEEPDDDFGDRWFKSRDKAIAYAI